MDRAMIKRLMALQMITQAYKKLGGNVSDLTTERMAQIIVPLFEAAPIRTDAEKRASLESLFHETVAEIIFTKEVA